MELIASSPPAPRRSGRWFYPALAAAAAVAARALYLIEFQHSPFFTYFFLDPLFHQQWAMRLASGHWIGNEAFFRAPLYPYFLAAIYYWTGGSLMAPRLAQFALGALSSALVCMIARRIFDRDLPALIAGLGFALYGPMIYFEGELLLPALIVFLDLLGLRLFFAARGKGTARWFALSGLGFGLSAIARPNVLAPALLLAGWAAGEGGSVRQQAVRRALPFLAALFLFPLLVTLRNGVVSGDYVFIASQGGINFYIGNNPAADGRTAVNTGMLASAGDEYRDSVWLNSVRDAEREAGKKLTASQVSAFWYEKALRFLVSDPGAAAALYGRKLFYLLHGHEIPSNNVPYFARNYSLLLRLLMWDHGVAFPMGVLMPLALTGMVLAWPERKRLAPLYIFTTAYALSIVLFFVVGRYRMPLIGPLIIFAVLAGKDARRLVAQRQWPRLAAAAALCTAIAVASNGSAFGVRSENLSLPLNNLGNYYYEQGRMRDAARAFQQAIREDPRDYTAIGNLGTIAFIAGDYNAAAGFFQRALLLDNQDPMLLFNMGLAQEKLGNLGAAADSFQRALDLAPGYEKARLNLQRIRAEIQMSNRPSGP